jgi:hypothetical protein
MTADTTNATALPGAATAPPARSRNAARAEKFVERAEHVAGEVWAFLRLLLFGVYLLVAVLAFWLWVINAVVGLIRLAFKTLMLVLLWLSGGMPPSRVVPPRTMTATMQLAWMQVWDLRLVAYEELVWPLRLHLQRFGRALERFWHWTLSRKAIAAAVIAWLVLVPALYLVPRPHEVQITDDNAVRYDSSTHKTTYLVHALDLHTDSKTREYINEDAWYLGKINSQGLKSQLQPGRTYRLWVVGIRWYYLPRLYPNIISATEIDAHGKEVARPARLAAPAQAAR